MTIPSLAMASQTRIPRAVSAARSREAILDAALELFAEQGYDDTTTEQVAERAGVSPRTFFRYFPTKESVVFYRDFGLMRRFETELRARSAALSDFDAVCSTFVSLSLGFDELRERVQLYRARRGLVVGAARPRAPALPGARVDDRPSARAPSRARGPE